MSKLEKRVFDMVCEFGSTHPSELEEHFGNKRVTNAWGGYSKETTRALEYLHRRGLLRIARRENGIRVYEATPPFDGPMSPTERLKGLIMLIANILAPVPEATLQANIARYHQLGNPRMMLRDLLKAGELEKQATDGISYVWPHSGMVNEEAPQVVRFMTPFDPLVWDRRRFEHLWRWPYRFEAYTPPAKRLRGYYAMPLLWRDSVIGWANAQVAGDHLNVEVGFVEKRPRDAVFRSELRAEIQRLETFLSLK
jgi:uncharacterized protein YcaQ